MACLCSITHTIGYSSRSMGCYVLVCYVCAKYFSNSCRAETFGIFLGAFTTTCPPPIHRPTRYQPNLYSPALKQCFSFRIIMWPSCLTLWGATKYLAKLEGHERRWAQKNSMSGLQHLKFKHYAQNELAATQVCISTAYRVCF